MDKKIVLFLVHNSPQKSGQNKSGSFGNRFKCLACCFGRASFAVTGKHSSVVKKSQQQSDCSDYGLVTIQAVAASHSDRSMRKVYSHQQTQSAH